jgi:hypothetical protein
MWNTQCGWFYYFLILCYPGTLLVYFLNDFEMVVVAHIITGVTFVFAYNTIVISIVTFMYGIYKYVPEINHVSTVYSVVAVLFLQFVLYVMLFCPWNMFITFTLTFPAVCVQCPIKMFFVSSLISCSSTEWFWNGYSRPYYYRFHFLFHIPHTLNFYYEVFIISASFLITFLYPWIATSIDMHVPFYYHGLQCPVYYYYYHHHHHYHYHYYYYYYHHHLTITTTTTTTTTTTATTTTNTTTTITTTTTTRAGRRIISFKLSCKLFSVIPAVGITSGTLLYCG